MTVFLGFQSNRISAIDRARGVAIVAMVIFHFSFDMMYFGYAPAGMVYQPAWRMFETSIASSFLFLAGLSFMLAHGQSFKPAKFIKQLTPIVFCAALISAVTYVLFADAMIRFGILHSIATLMVLAIILRHVPPVGLALLAATILAGYFWVAVPVELPAVFGALIYTDTTSFSVDYRPLVPWAAAFVLGMSCAVFVKRTPSSHPHRHRRWWLLEWAGQHSLMIYMLHQPILFAGFYLVQATNA